MFLPCIYPTVGCAPSPLTQTKTNRQKLEVLSLQKMWQGKRGPGITDSPVLVWFFLSASTFKHEIKSFLLNRQWLSWSMVTIINTVWYGYGTCLLCTGGWPTLSQWCDSPWKRKYCKLRQIFMCFLDWDTTAVSEYKRLFVFWSLLTQNQSRLPSSELLIFPF